MTTSGESLTTKEFNILPLSWLHHQKNQIIEYEELKNNDCNGIKFIQELPFITNSMVYILIKGIFQEVVDESLWRDKLNVQMVYNKSKKSKRNLEGSRFICYLDPEESEFISPPDYLTEFFEILNLIFPRGDIKNLSILFSDKNTVSQDLHLDYKDLQNNWPSLRIPLIGLIALQDNVSIILEDQKISVERGNAIIFKGNTYHRGGSWKECSGARLHFFIDVPGYQNFQDMANAFASENFQMSNIKISSNIGTSTRKKIHDQNQTKKINCLLTLLSLNVELRKFLCNITTHTRDQEIEYLKELMKGKTTRCIDFNTIENKFPMIQAAIDRFIVDSFMKIEQRYGMTNPFIRMLESMKLESLILGFGYPLTFNLIYEGNFVVENLTSKNFLAFKDQQQCYVYELYIILMIKRTIQENEEDYQIYIKDYTKHNTWINKDLLADNSASKDDCISKTIDEIQEVLCKQRRQELECFLLFYRRVTVNL